MNQTLKESFVLHRLKLNMVASSIGREEGYNGLFVQGMEAHFASSVSYMINDWIVSKSSPNHRSISAV